MSSSLAAVDFNLSTGMEVSGLVHLYVSNPSLSLAEKVAVQEAESIRIDEEEVLNYVFFRRFTDGRSPQIAAYVIDNSDGRHNEHKLARIHREVWLNGSAPLLYVGWPTRVDILSCARGPDFWRDDESGDQYNPAQRIATEPRSIHELITTSAVVSESLENRFSALRLSNGTFWDDPRNVKLARADQAAHRRLIQAVIEADAALEGEQHPVLRRLLLLTVLIKYLEDRGVFPEGWFGQFHPGAVRFFDFLQKGTPEKLGELLDSLERKFNGDVFSLPENGTHTLTTKQLRHFATLVESKTLRQQRYLWEPYSFQHLPVEVLSHLYQHFAQRGKGAIYTPPFVTSLLLDFALPYDRITGDERILDPTCGSGVFLVGAFRRLVNHWSSRNGWRQPDVQTLKTILKRSIFGVELQSESLHLAEFNLALAVCDALKPNVIWNELHFDKLHGANLVEGDFFDFVEQQPQPFDVILGNPPFLSELTEAAERVNKDATAARGTLPDNQTAYLVAEQAMGLLNEPTNDKEGGRLCLIQPAGLLYNEKARGFQRHVLAAHNIEHLLDFISIRGLFDKADTKIVALVATKTKPAPKHYITHLTFRRTFSVQEQIGFELDHYDRHVIPQEQAVTAPYTWKVNLLGGGRLHHLAARLKKMGKLIDFVTDKDWEYGEGFIAAEGGRRQEASWLTGKPLLPSEALTEHGIDEGQITQVKTELFRSFYTKERYSPPLMLIRENEKLQCGFWDQGFLAYKAQVVGITTHESQRSELLHFYNEFRTHRNILSAFCLLLGTRALVSKATAVNKTDIDNLPWPEEGESWDLAPWEQTMCNDLVEYIADYVRLGQDSPLLKKQADAADLRQYADCYCTMLGSVYHNLKAGQWLSLDGLICQSFHFGDEPQLDWPADWSEPLHKLIYVQRGDVLRTTRMVRFYDSNVILLIKPDRLRYWIPSIAIRDADETLVDLRNQGY